MSTTTKQTTQKAKSPVSSRSDFVDSGGFTYPAKLVEGGQEQLESGNWRLKLVFDRHDRVWADGNPVKAYSSALTTCHNGADPMWPGSPSDLITASFEEATGDSLNVLDDDSIAGFIGHSFMLTDEVETDSDGQPRTYTDKNGKERKSYITTCTEYLGDDYVFDGVPTVAGGDGGAGPEAEAQDDAATLAQLFDGQNVDELRGGLALDLVKDCDALADVKNVLGKPLRGALVKPKAVLIDILIENGYARNVDGTFTAGGTEEDDIPFE